MFLSKSKSGIYLLYYVKDGRKTKVSTKTKYKSEALKFLSTFSERLKAQEVQKVTPIKLQSFLFAFLKHSETIHSWNTTLSYKSTVNALLDYFGDIEVRKLDHESLSKYLRYRVQKVSLYVGKREKAYLSAICKWGIANSYLLTNITQNIKLRKLPEKLPIFFSPEAFDAFIKIVDDPDLRDLINFAVNTGLRQMEILTLRWNHVDLKKKFIVLDNTGFLTKSKKVRAIPLNNCAFGILSQRNAADHVPRDFIFLYKGKPINQQFISHKFKKMIKKTELNPKLNFHSLRHTFASWLIQRGAPIYEVSKILGHSNIKTTEIYTHLYPEDLRRSINLLNEVYSKESLSPDSISANNTINLSINQSK